MCPNACIIANKDKADLYTDLNYIACWTVLERKLKTNGRLANLELTSLVKEAMGHLA